MAEAIGLALAVLPLLILAVDHFDSAQTLRAKIGDDRILEFYEEVAFEIFLLRNCLKRLVKDLPGISLEYKAKVLRSIQPESWGDEALSDALRAKLGEINYPIFEMTLRRLLESLNALVSSNQQFLSSEIVSPQQRIQQTNPVSSALDSIFKFLNYRLTRTYFVLNLACSGRI
jgi:hypothetical protein